MNHDPHRAGDPCSCAPRRRRAVRAHPPSARRRVRMSRAGIALETPSPSAGDSSTWRETSAASACRDVCPRSTASCAPLSSCPTWQGAYQNPPVGFPRVTPDEIVETGDRIARDRRHARERDQRGAQAEHALIIRRSPVPARASWELALRAWGGRAGSRAPRGRTTRSGSGCAHPRRWSTAPPIRPDRSPRCSAPRWSRRL